MSLQKAYCRDYERLRDALFDLRTAIVDLPDDSGLTEEQLAGIAWIYSNFPIGYGFEADPDSIAWSEVGGTGVDGQGRSYDYWRALPANFKLTKFGDDGTVQNADVEDNGNEHPDTWTYLGRIQKLIGDFYSSLTSEGSSDEVKRRAQVLADTFVETVKKWREH